MDAAMLPSAEVGFVVLVALTQLRVDQMPKIVEGRHVKCIFDFLIRKRDELTFERPCRKKYLL
jgi:hypothetical protein